MFKPYFGILIFLLAKSLGANPTTEDLNSVDTKLHEKLSELEASVASSAAREIEFREERSFPFRSKPIQLEGILRLLEGVGISIEYPDNRTVLILDDLGVLMRKISENGSVREKSSGIGDGATAILLKAALGFDRTELERLFFLTWFEDEEGWSIVMTPRSEKESSVDQVTMTGRALVIDRIEFGFSGRKKITIFPLEELLKDEFSEEEQEKYFRNSVVEGK